MTTIAALKARAAKLVGSLSTEQLITSLTPLDDDYKAGTAGPEARMIRSWIIAELEQRFPAASDAVDKVFYEDALRVERGEDGPEIDYVAVLLAAIKDTAK